MSLIKCYRVNRKARVSQKKDRDILRQHIHSVVDLTKEEKHQIANKWKCTIPVPISRGFDFFLGMKYLNGFDPNYLPPCYYAPYILDALNIPAYKKILNHKSLLQIAYGNGIKHPRTVIRSYGGLLLDENYHALLRHEAAAIIKKQNCPLLYKPAMDSSQGKKIQVLANTEDIEEICKGLVNGELIKKGDFVIQEPVAQSTNTELFNPTSLNCMRITTFRVNDYISVGSSAIKCGPAGSFVDNIGSGKKGVIVGIDRDGQLHKYGFYGNGERTAAHNGVEFKDKKIMHFDRVINAAIELHNYVEGCRIIGWDLALDNQDDPVLIEGNVCSPGIRFEQMCSGPIFGDRTDEVIGFIKKNLG